MTKKPKEMTVAGRPVSVGDQIEWWPMELLKPYDRNSRTHSPEQIEAIRRSIVEFGWTTPALVQPNGTIIAGHARIEAAKKEGYEQAKVIVAHGWSEAKIKAYVIADNKLAEMAGWDEELLKAEIAALREFDFDISLLGFDEGELEKLFAEGLQAEQKVGNLAERFGIAPFSVFNAREGWWQERKRAWLALGIQSEIGRGENLLAFSDTVLEPDPKKRAERRAKAFNSQPGRHGRSPETEAPLDWKKKRPSKRSGAAT